VVGWSPGGLDYDAIDGETVHLVVMYRVPDSRKSEYLTEIANLVRLVLRNHGAQVLAGVASLEEARRLLLSWMPAAQGG
jgi:mannitol/fructose-specific phosphotransferase system IIA component (Ntr-type)